jgi:hypothetical protein
LRAAARELGTSAESLRRWVREEGCPALEGGPGRGKGYRVDLAAVRAWRAARAPQGDHFSLEQLGGLALDFWRRGTEPSEPGQRLLGIRDSRAAAFLVLFIGYAARRLGVEGLGSPELQQLEAIARQEFANGKTVHALNDSV